jgi:AraC family transcriptional regulator
VRSNAEKSVGRAIATMHANLGERVTLDDLARVAQFSKFHFSRVFQERTGLSPARFLAALRLAAAKEMLLTTPLSVAEISLRVGYSSIGTFSTLFKAGVGLAPSTFRANGGRLPRSAAPNRFAQACGSVEGGVTLSETAVDATGSPAPAHPVVLGLFPGPAPHGLPVACAIIDGPGPFEMPRVPVGSWNLLAYVPPAPGEFSAGTRRLVGSGGRVTVRAQHRVRAGEVRLRPALAVDPPVLVAAPDLRRVALAQRG